MRSCGVSASVEMQLKPRSPEPEGFSGLECLDSRFGLGLSWQFGLMDTRVQKTLWQAHVFSDREPVASMPEGIDVACRLACT